MYLFIQGVSKKCKHLGNFPLQQKLLTSSLSRQQTCSALLPHVIITHLVNSDCLPPFVQVCGSPAEPQEEQTAPHYHFKVSPTRAQTGQH